MYSKSSKLISLVVISWALGAQTTFAYKHGPRLNTGPIFACCIGAGYSISSQLESSLLDRALALSLIAEMNGISGKMSESTSTNLTRSNANFKGEIYFLELRVSLQTADLSGFYFGTMLGAGTARFSPYAPTGTQSLYQDVQAFQGTNTTTTGTVYGASIGYEYALADRFLLDIGLRAWRGPGGFYGYEFESNGQIIGGKYEFAQFTLLGFTVALTYLFDS